MANIQIAPTIVPVASSVGTTAFNDAQTLSTDASALTATQTFTSITGTTTITGNGGLNVIDVTGSGNSVQNPTLTLSGTANDFFVFNIPGNFNENNPMILSGVEASHILFNLTGTSGNIFSTSGGNVLFGTFLATDGGDFPFSSLDLTGQLINTGGHIQFVSGSEIGGFDPFTPPVSSIPEPASWALLGGALLVFGIFRLKLREFFALS